jgi:NAD+ synthase (glutamine-hydrolysing)
VFDAGGVRVGLLICEDAWYAEPARQAKAAGAELLAVINASPFHQGKGAEREAVMQARARRGPAAGVGALGGQDEVVFDGQSFVIGADGEVAGRAPAFEEKLWFARVHKRKQLFK